MFRVVCDTCQVNLYSSWLKDCGKRSDFAIIKKVIIYKIKLIIEFKIKRKITKYIQVK